jgi:hypothetical protein
VKKKLIILLGIAVILGIFGVRSMPKSIGEPLSVFIIIFGAVLTLLALYFMGFEKVDPKQWWEN